MITLRRHGERLHDTRGAHEVWLTFSPLESADSLAAGFGCLTALDETRLPPASVAVPQPGDEAEIVTYVHRAALTQEDSAGSSGVLHAGEFQHMTVGRALRRKESNASQTDWAHVFRITLRPSAIGLASAREQMLFPAALRHNRLCVVASPDGRTGSLRTLQDVIVYSSVLDPGHHLIHELLPDHSAWVHVVCGEVTLHDVVLGTGDGVGVTTELSVSMTAQESSEILLVDVGPAPREARTRTR